MAEDSYRLGQTGIAAFLQALQATRDVRLRALQAAADFQRALATSNARSARRFNDDHHQPFRASSPSLSRPWRPAAAAGPEEVETAAVVPVTVEAAAAGTLQSAAHVSGIVEPAPGADLVVTAPASARIVEMPKAEGDVVRSGDLLVRFEIPSLAADTAAKRAEIERANARLQNARSAQARAQDLFDRGVGARRRSRMPTASWPTPRRRWPKRRPISPRQPRSRDVPWCAPHSTASSRSAPITRATSWNRVRPIRSCASSIRAGSKSRRRCNSPTCRTSRPARRRASASVRAIRSRRKSFPRRGGRSGDGRGAGAPAFDRPTRLPAGTPVQVEIETQVHENVVLVPAAAVIREGDEAVVFVAAGDKAQRRAVETGLTDGEHVEITKGVKAGELVITKGRTAFPTARRSARSLRAKREKRIKSRTRIRTRTKPKRSPHRTKRPRRPAPDENERRVHGTAPFTSGGAHRRRSGRGRGHRRAVAAEQHLPAARVPAHRHHRAQRDAAAAVDDADRHAADRAGGDGGAGHPPRAVDAASAARPRSPRSSTRRPTWSSRCSRCRTASRRSAASCRPTPS